jgi:RNA polymerase sigma-70 factor (ECF subfamily)
MQTDLSHFHLERDYISKIDSESMNKIGCTESMIRSVNKQKTAPLETSGTGLSQAEFESVFGKYWAHVYRILHRLVVDPTEAEDLALETFVRLYQRFPLEEKDFQLGGWLYRVATNLGLRSIRSFKRREQYELAAGKNALDSAPDSRPSEVFAQLEEQTFARQALAQMNERQSQLLILRYSSLSYKEIASALDLASSSIGPLLLRAEREFEACYRAIAQEEA